jgi:hypothetical protein
VDSAFFRIPLPLFRYSRVALPLALFGNFFYNVIVRNCCHRWPDVQVDSLTDRKVARQADRQTGQQTARQTKQQAESQTDKMACRQPGRQNDVQTARKTK